MKTAEQLEAATDLQPQGAAARLTEVERHFAEDHRAAELVSPGGQSFERCNFRGGAALQFLHIGAKRECHRIVHVLLEAYAFCGRIAANDPARAAFAGCHDERPVGVLGAQGFQR